MTLAPRLERRIGKLVEGAALALACAGGLLLAAVAVMTVVSITGRMLTGLGLGPVPGDYELVANGSGLAVFSFLPWCHLKRGHVTVDVLINRFSARGQAIFGLIGDLLVAAAAWIILRQLWLGFGEKYPYGSDALRDRLGMGYRPFFPETTYELQIPVWGLYLAAVLGAAFFFVTALYCVWRALNWALAGQEGTV